MINKEESNATKPYSFKIKNTINVQNLKDKIASFLNEKGPSLPVHLAKHIGLNLMFTSAILSELLQEKKLKTSNLRIGSSPLYLLPGQEEKLENFSDNLNGKEKEAFLLLKENRLLNEEDLEPAIRVALKSIKDFALPMFIHGKTFWKYFTVKNEEAWQIINNNMQIDVQEAKMEAIHKAEEKDQKEIGKSMMQDIEKEKKKESDIERIKRIAEEIQEKSKELEKIKDEALKAAIYEDQKRMGRIEIKEEPKQIIEIKEEVIKEQVIQPEIIVTIKEEIKPIEIKEEQEKEIKEIKETQNEKIEVKQKKGKKEKVKDNSFLIEVKEILSKKQIEIVSIEDYDKKEVIAKIKQNSQLMLLMAFNKKKLTEKEILKAYKKSQIFNLPYYILQKGETPKKIKETMEAYKNLAKIDMG